MNKISFLTVAVVALALLNAALVFGFFTRRIAPLPDPGPRDIVIRRLRFDADQTKAYDGLIERHRADIRQKESEMTSARQAIYSLLKSGDFSKKDSLTAEVGRLQIAIENIHLDHFKDIKKICRTEQAAYFDALAGDLAGYFTPPPPKK